MASSKPDPALYGKIADEPFEWMSENCTWFRGKLDLEGVVVVSKPRDQIKLEEFMHFGAWHALHIHGDLNGFRGYDCVRFEFAESEVAGARFVVHEGSISAHCCFLASVLDTQGVNRMSDAVCECYDKVDAARIAKLLNAEAKV